jgi:hypothetical protein
MLQFTAFRRYLIPSYCRGNVAESFHTYSINVPAFSKKDLPEEINNTTLHFSGNGTAHAGAISRGIGAPQPFFEMFLI